MGWLGSRVGGFRFQVLGFIGFRVQALGFRVFRFFSDPGFRVQDLGFKV